MCCPRFSSFLPFFPSHPYSRISTREERSTRYPSIQNFSSFLFSHLRVPVTLRISLSKYPEKSKRTIFMIYVRSTLSSGQAGRELFQRVNVYACALVSGTLQQMNILVCRISINNALRARCQQQAI